MHTAEAIRLSELDISGLLHDQSANLVHVLSEDDVRHFLDELPPQTEACVIVPAYNEEPVIESSLRALTEIFAPEDIYVVSDGSTDRTAELAQRFTPNVLDLKENQGKARALKALIEQYNLVPRYEYILFSDADSRLSSNFLSEVKKHADSLPACIVGTVTSDRHGLISAYRTYEYAMTNRIFKEAQSKMQVVTVAPGCASLYRGDVLSELDFSNHTLTEDFDLTLQIHEKNLGRIIFASNAKVITQDPPTMRDYWKQITRWYTGFWQNVRMHQVYKPTSMVNAEIMLIVGDGLSWLLAIALAFLNPSAAWHLFLISLAITEVLAFSVLALERQWWAIKYMPLFSLFQFVNVASYAYSFFRSMNTDGKRLSWQKVARYAA